jgi:predicted nucleic acid-binding protein
VALSRYCLDTSAYSHLRRGDPRAIQLVDAAEWIGLPSITMGELRVGFRQGSREAENESRLQDFLSHPSVEEVTVDSDVSSHYAGIVTDLLAAGTPLPANDIWIAACSARHGALVLTYDRHFEKIVRVGALILGG